MKRRLLLTTGVASLAVLTGCAGPQIADYANDRPTLDLRSYFNGMLDAYGVFTDRSGQVVKRFTVVMRCSWTGEDGVLDEDFSYSDGTTQKRIWRLKHLGNGRYTGTADDVIGASLRFAKSNVVQQVDSLSALRHLPWGGETFNHGDRHEFAFIQNSGDLRLHLPMVLDR